MPAGAHAQAEAPDAPQAEAPETETEAPDAPQAEAPETETEAPDAPETEASDAPALEPLEAPEPEAPAPEPEASPAPSSVRGTVLDRASRQPVAGATVMLAGTSFAALTEADGSYVIEQVPPGRYQVQVITHQSAEAGAQAELHPGQVAQVDLLVDSTAFAGEIVVVTGTRSPEKIFDAPLTVESVGAEQIKRSGGASYLSALSDVKGIDFADAGINDQRISARGFTTQFNSRMLSMVDGRMAQIPGNGLPQANLLPTSGLDMKAIEVVIGPASALYGPNAHTGVVNVITKSPWDESGAALSMRGGTQSLADGAMRLAGTVNDNLGWKVNAQYLRADDFEPSADEGTHSFGTGLFEGDLLHDYRVASTKGDASLYYRAGDWQAKASYGISENTGFSLTNAGRNHIRDWRIQYQAAQLSHPKWYAQVTRTASDAGGTYQLDRLAREAEALAEAGQPIAPADLDALRDQIRFIDKSQMLDSELQFRDTFAGIKTAMGAQWRMYLPSSEGTYLADAGGEDISAMEVGGYVQLDRSLMADRLRLVGAARIDSHTNYAPQVSPKASAVYAVAPQHRIRAAYNRAFKSPTILENYLLINQVLLGNREGFTVRDADGNVLSEIGALAPEEVNALEIGYKGTIGRALFVDAVAYQSWYRNFISPLTPVASPALGTFGHHADGTRVAAGSPAEGTLSTYMNFGQAVVRGADLGVSAYPVNHVTVSASASVLSLADFTNDDALQNDLLLNVPTFKLKGAVTVDSLGLDGYFVRVAGRFHTAYAFESGYWRSESFFDDGKIPARFVLDLSAGYEIPGTDVSVRAYALNALGNTTVDVLGAPTPGRLLYLQIGYAYRGLVF